MSWPNANDFVDAVQNPRVAFGDPDLQSATIECDTLGLPKPRSGNFATVFKATASAGRAWAVRCFTREVSGQGERYAAISNEVSRHKWPFLSGFTYLPDGIRVQGHWHPLLKMEWVQGDGLIRYVERHLGSPERLRSLADGLSDVVRTLSTNGIAHGDLQHGNILVVNDRPVLIDYDGMFVPGFAGRVATEIGLPSFQHPKRTSRHFDARLDHFALWGLGVSLLGLAADPKLWTRYDRRKDDCLLFRKSDFVAPEQSDLLRDLENSSDGKVREYAVRFRRVLGLDPLDAGLFATSPDSDTRPVPSVRVSVPTDDNLPWWKSHLPPPPQITPQTVEKVAYPIRWGDDPENERAVTFAPPPGPAGLPTLPKLPRRRDIRLEFDSPPQFDQAAVVGAVVGGTVLVLLGVIGVYSLAAGGALTGLAFTLAGVFIWLRYRTARSRAIRELRIQRNLLFGLSDEQYRVQYIFECDADRVTNAVQGNIDALTLYGGKIGVEVQQQIEDLLRHRNLTLWEDLRTYLRRRREEIEELFRFLDDEFANASTRLSFWTYLKEIFH